MAAELRARLKDGDKPEAKLKALNDYLFNQNGFHGSRADYYDRANSYINEVLDEREGQPITLSLVYMELARRIGLGGIAGVPLPGHFIVRVSFPEAKPQLLDIFNGGKLLSTEDAADLVQTYSERPMDKGDLDPATKRQIILRILRNLIGAEDRGAASDVTHYYDAILALSPDSAFDRLSRARARMQASDLDGAREDLKWILDHQPEGVNLDRVEELYRALEK
jgi:regulator of sirC expression with transglutaminase-like and TPR domain